MEIAFIVVNYHTYKIQSICAANMEICHILLRWIKMKCTLQTYILGHLLLIVNN